VGEFVQASSAGRPFRVLALVAPRHDPSAARWLLRRVRRYFRTSVFLHVRRLFVGLARRAGFRPVGCTGLMWAAQSRRNRR
jgi:hypothetical protein